MPPELGRNRCDVCGLLHERARIEIDRCIFSMSDNVKSWARAIVEFDRGRRCCIYELQMRQKVIRYFTSMLANVESLMRRGCEP